MVQMRESHQREQAIALKYSSNDELPQVVASGSGEMARRILKLALDNNVPVHEDKLLAEILSTLKPGSTINDESFTLVASVITFLYHTDKAFKETHSFLDTAMNKAELQAESPPPSQVALATEQLLSPTK